MSDDNLTAAGAAQLAETINRYWHSRGCTVAVRVEKADEGSAAVHWVVRSDLGLTLPVRARPEQASRVG